MKKITISFLIVFSYNFMLSQSGAKWSEGGNSIGASSFIGTTNNFPFDFRVNNVQQMSLGVNGVLTLKSLIGSGNRVLLTDPNGNMSALPVGTSGQFLQSNGTWANLPSGATIWTTSGNDIFSTNSGNVGIGNSSPTYKLDVTGNTRVTGDLFVGGGVITSQTITAGTKINAGDADVTGNLNLSGNLKINSLAGSGNTQLFVDNSGNVFKQANPSGGACVSPNNSWHLGGDNIIGLQPFSSPVFEDIGTCDNVDFILKAANAQRIWLKTDGTIGFGTNIISNTNGPEYRFKTGVVRLQNTNTYGGPQVIFDFDNNSTPYGDWGIEYSKALTKNGLNFWKPFGSTNSNNNFFFLADDGTVGIGTDNPLTKLTIDAWGGDGLKVLVDPNTNAFDIFNKTTGLSEFKVKSEGIVYAREIIVKLGTFPDYVFNREYKLPSLSETKKFVLINHHLKNMPTESEIKCNGANIGEIQKVTVEKLEEAYLYIFQLEEKLNILSEKLSKLEKEK